LKIEAPQSGSEPARKGSIVVGPSIRIALVVGPATALSLLGATALAQPADGPVWTRRPTQADVEKYYPTWSAGGAGGSVALRCRVAANGSLNSCAVAAELPPDVGFGAAAIRMASVYRMKPLSAAGKPVAGATVVVPVTFELSGGTRAPELNTRPGDAAILVTPLKGAPAASAAVIPCPSDADPRRRCAGHVFTWRNRASPAATAELLRSTDQRSGVTLVECSAGSDGRLSACRVGGDATEQTKTALIEYAGLFRAPAFARDSTPTRAGRVLMEIDWGLINTWTPAA
jgi:TonB family protein